MAPASSWRLLSLPLLLLPLLAACGEDPIIDDDDDDGEPLAGCAAIRALPARHPISPERLAARREATLDSLGTGVAIFAAGYAIGHEATGNQERQNSNFYWLTGLEHVDSGLLVLISTENGGHLARLYLEDEIDAPAGEPAVALTGALDLRCLENAHGELLALLESDTLPAPDALVLSIDFDSDTLLGPVLDEAGIFDYRTAIPLMARLRAVKDAEEIALLGEGARVTADAILRGMSTTDPGDGEQDLQNVIEARFDESGAVRTAFASIVASGENALVLHYNENDEPLDEGELVVVDVGVEYGRYAADVGRTFPVSGTFTPRQRELYEFLLGALEAGIDAARVGSSMGEIDNAIALFLENSGDLCGDVNCYNYMTHFGGHYVGLDVHDGSFGINNFLPLQPGVVLNVEPGIYLPHEGIGLRLEETVLVTEGDPVVLSTGAPLSVEDIEAAMAQD